MMWTMHSWKVVRNLFVLGCILGVLSGCSFDSISQVGVAKRGESATFKGRSDAPEAIDKEFNKRFAKKVKEAQDLFRETDQGLELSHKFGTTILPKNPQRIVVIRMEDPMVALDAPMVGAYMPENFYLHDELVKRGVTSISINEETKTINLEQIQQLRPDLIVFRDSFDKNTYLALSKIAPVAAFNLQNTEVSLLALAKSLGIEERGQERLREYYKVAKESRLAIKNRIGDSEFAFLRVMRKELRIYPYTKSHISRFIYELLNLHPDAMTLAHDGAGGNNRVSVEMLPDITAKYILVSTGYGAASKQGPGAADKQFVELEQEPLWNRLEAVKNHHIHIAQRQEWNSHGIIAKERCMKELAEWLSQ